MERPEGLPDWVEPAVVLDADHAVTFVCYPGETEPCGGLIWHRNPAKGEGYATPGWCAGGFYWRDRPGFPPKPLWTLDALDPLTVSPSIRCSCGEHGFIKQGRWVPA